MIKARRLLGILFSLLTLNSCFVLDIFGVNKTMITVINGDEEIEHEIFIANKGVKIDPPVKEGYFLRGIYSSTEGGKRFFYGTGKVDNLWKRTNSKKMYCQWGTLDEVSYETSTNSNSSGSSASFTFDNVHNYLASAGLSNPERDITLELKFNIRASSYSSNNLKIDMYVSADNQKYAENTLQTTSEWVERSEKLYIPGIAVVNQKMRIVFVTKKASFADLSAPQVYISGCELKAYY